MKALWLELGDSEITAIPIHFMAWSDKSATARWMKPKRATRLLRRHVIRFLDRDAIADAPAPDRGICLRRRASQPLRLLLSRALPAFGPVYPRRSRPGGAAKGSHGAHRKAENLQGAVIEHAVVPGANHFFEDRLEPLISEVGA